MRPRLGIFSRRRRKKQLLDCAARLGLKGVSKLSREDLAGRIEVAFAGLAGLHVRVRRSRRAGAVGRRSRERRRCRSRTSSTSGPARTPCRCPRTFPGATATTASRRWPSIRLRLYVYWEVTDDAIAAARAGLGAGGERAWLNLRVYDITGRLFDGTNAHSYFDHRVERHERQWFFAIDKPTSTACVEVGLRSEEGYFVKIARSGRVDFPRTRAGRRRRRRVAERARRDAVRSAAAVAGAPAGGGARRRRSGPGGRRRRRRRAAAAAPAARPASRRWQDWTRGRAASRSRAASACSGARWQRQEAHRHQWTSDWARTEWVGPVLRTEWESGPFTYPVDVPAGSIEVQDNGEVSVRSEGGRTHVMYGPWQVVIRGIGARAERRVLGTWEYRRQIAVEGGVERDDDGRRRLRAGQLGVDDDGRQRARLDGRQRAAVARRQRAVAAGRERDAVRGRQRARVPGRQRVPLPRRQRAAAARAPASGAWAARPNGCSRARASSMYAGASERMLGGASERFGGASERFGGASEHVDVGAADATPSLRARPELPLPRPAARPKVGPPCQPDISRSSCTPTCRSSVTPKIRR